MNKCLCNLNANSTSIPYSLDFKLSLNYIYIIYTDMPTVTNLIMYNINGTIFV